MENTSTVARSVEVPVSVLMEIKSICARSVVVVGSASMGGSAVNARNSAVEVEASANIYGRAIGARR